MCGQLPCLFNRGVTGNASLLNGSSAESVGSNLLATDSAAANHVVFVLVLNEMVLVLVVEKRLKSKTSHPPRP